VEEDAKQYHVDDQEGELEKVEQDLTVDALRDSDERYWFSGRHWR
jgi:hypothetical protein